MRRTAKVVKLAGFARCLTVVERSRINLYMDSHDPIDPPTPAGARPAAALPPRASPSRLSLQRLRQAMYGSFAVLAVAVMLLAWSFWRSAHNPSATPEQMRNLALVGVGLVLLCLGLLAWLVVEPAGAFIRKQHRRVARQTEHLQQLAQVARHTASMVTITDREDRIVWVNDAFTTISGWALKEARGKFPAELLYSPRAEATALARLSSAVESGEGVRLDLLYRTRDGRDLWLDTDMQPLRDSAGRTSGFVSLNTDITAQRGERAQTSGLLGALPLGVLVQAADGQIIEVNEAAVALLGRSRATLLASSSPASLLMLLRADGGECAPKDLPFEQARHSGQAVREAVLGLRGPDGQIRWLQMDAAPLVDSEGEPGGVATCLVDVTERRRLEQRVAELAQVDALTRLPNRSAVLERVRRALEHVARNPAYGFAVLFMDFDRFKQVNDTLGHNAGDELLRQVSARMLETLRPGDAVARLETTANGQNQNPPQTAARFGGDEFVVVLEGVRDEQQVRVIAERLMHELAQPYNVFEHPVQSSVSMGVVTAAHAAATAEDVLRDADTAMFEAKRGGHGHLVMFEPAMRERLVRDMAIENELRRALRETELFVLYQPVVDLADGQMNGVEALVRWLHPQRGVLLPAQFLQVAEDCGLMAELGEFVLVQACRQFTRWRRALGSRAPKQLAVNLAAGQLVQPGLVDMVRRVLQGCDMAPCELQLEVTESFAAQDARSLATMHQLKELGVGLALDDFGTGSSSLSCLHELPVVCVKIDPAFVTQAATVEYHRVLVKAIISMSRALGITTVAEGVETVQQGQLMAELGCNRGQGYLYGSPMSADELLHWSASAGTAWAASKAIA